MRRSSRSFASSTSLRGTFLLPPWPLSRFTRRQVTVALGGDGGDELFAGYDTFRG